MKNQKNIMKKAKFMNAVIFAINIQILGIMEQTNQFVKIVQKNIKYLNCKNHHKIKNQLFTENELSFIVDSLNETFNNAVRKLETKILGDLERGFIEKTRDKAKELIMQITA